MKIVAWFLTSLVVLSANSAYAGNVRASIQGGNLYIYGDNAPNNVVIESSSAGNIRISSASSSGEPTTINSRSTPAVFTNWTGGIFAYLYDGDDSLTLLSGDVRGAVHIDVGAGTDDVFLGQTLESSVTTVLSGSQSAPPLNLRSSLFIIGSQGADLVAVDNSIIAGRTTIDLGSQSDQFYAADVTFGDNVLILPADSADEVGMLGCRIALDLIIDDSVGALTADLDDVHVGRNAFIYGTPSPDYVLATNLRVANLFQVFGESGTDNINLGGQAKILEVFAGADSDRVGLTAMTSPTVRVFLDGGVDSLTIKDSDITALYAYGGADNDTFTVQGTVINDARIYGDGGTDTFRRTAASINRLYLYSVEVR